MSALTQNKALALRGGAASAQTLLPIGWTGASSRDGEVCSGLPPLYPYPAPS